LRQIFLGGRGVDTFALLYFAKIWGLNVRRISVCGYEYIHGYPRKICGYGYGYGWEISYRRQACQCHSVWSVLRLTAHLLTHSEVRYLTQQEILADAHETRESL